MIKERLQKWLEKPEKESQTIAYATYTLDNIPVKTFCILLDDESKCEYYGISKKNWESIKEEYKNNNSTPEQDALLEEFRKVVKISCENSGLKMLLNIVLGVPSDWKPYFEKLGMRYAGDRVKDRDNLLKEIQKLETKEKIHSKRLQKLEEQIKEFNAKKEKTDFDLKKVNEAIASLELAGSNIPDYDTLTFGKYEALGEVHRKRNVKNGK